MPVGRGSAGVTPSSTRYNGRMDYSPRAESVRLAAAAGYLPLVAFYLLAQRKHRDVRLIGFHAYQGIGTLTATGTLLVLGGVVSTLFGDLPGLGFLINMGVGFFYLAVMVGYVSFATYGAYTAYQGAYTSTPVLSDWAWRLVNGGQATRPPKRRRRPEVSSDASAAEQSPEAGPYQG